MSSERKVKKNKAIVQLLPIRWWFLMSKIRCWPFRMLNTVNVITEAIGNHDNQQFRIKLLSKTDNPHSKFNTKHRVRLWRDSKFLKFDKLHCMRLSYFHQVNSRLQMLEVQDIGSIHKITSKLQLSIDAVYSHRNLISCISNTNG